MIFPLRSCPAPWEITRAASEGASLKLQEHLSQCADCCALYQEESSLASLAPALSLPAPALERRQSTKQRLLANLPQQAPRQSWPRVLALAASVLLLIGGAYWLLPTRQDPLASAPEVLTKIEPTTGAVFSQQKIAQQEKILLSEGKLSLSVKPRAHNEALTVSTKDALISPYQPQASVTQSARFEVFATHEQLQSVYVWEGLVELHYLDQPSIIISAGEHWERPGAPSSAQVVPMSIPASAPTTTAIQEPASEPKVAKGNPNEEAFADGFALMREKKFAEAALSFGRAAKSKGSLQEDALFWQAMALGRARQDTEAKSALESFLLRYPSSPRSGEAALALGWILFDSGDTDGARRWFKVAARDSSSTVQQHAQEALQQLPSE